MNYQEWKESFDDYDGKFGFNVYNQDGLKHFRKHNRANFIERQMKESCGIFI